MRQLLILILLAFAGAACAQSPERVVQLFTDAINKKDIQAAAKYVKGGVVPDFITKEIQSAKAWPHFVLDKVSASAAGEYAIVAFDVKDDSPVATPAHHEFLVLSKSGDDWLIEVPYREGLGTLAFYLSNPPIIAEARASAQATTCLSNVKQLATGILMFEADHDDVLAATAANWQKNVMPYVKENRLFTCPLDVDRGAVVSYSINAKLLGKSATSIDAPADTVLVYEGKNGQLDFRHNGRAAVAFADGHARLVDVEMAKKLVWK